MTLDNQRKFVCKSYVLRIKTIFIENCDLVNLIVHLEYKSLFIYFHFCRNVLQYVSPKKQNQHVSTCYYPN
jgi:hypothetical protein